MTSDLRQQLEASIKLENAKNALSPTVMALCARFTQKGLGWEDIWVKLMRTGLATRYDLEKVRAACKRAWQCSDW